MEKKWDVLAFGELLVDFTQNGISSQGNDIFGQLLKSTLEELSIDTSALHFDKAVRTTLAFVANDENGDRSFSFWNLVYDT